MPGTIQGSWDTLVSKTGKDPCPFGVYILVGRGVGRQYATDKQQINKLCGRLEDKCYGGKKKDSKENGSRNARGMTLCCFYTLWSRWALLRR